MKLVRIERNLIIAFAIAMSLSALGAYASTGTVRSNGVDWCVHYAHVLICSPNGGNYDISEGGR